MKTILTTITFAIAMMVFAFNANPVMANEETQLDENCTVYTSGVVKCDTPAVAQVDDPGQAEGDEKEFAYRIEAWCDRNPALRAAICSDNGFEWIKQQFAGMTRRQKQQQDEDDWNAWILQQFAVYQNDDNESFDGFERDIADSGNEGSTSAAGASDR